MRQTVRSLVVVCLLGVAVSAFATPSVRDARSGVRKFVKTVVRALGDFITVPIPAPKP